MAEAEAAHRREIEKKIIETQATDLARFRRAELSGQIFGLLIGLTALIEWYGSILEQEQDERAESLRVVTPCCGQLVPFSELQFINGGFAMFELQVSNPHINYPMPDRIQSKLESVLGCAMKQVWARY